MQGTGVDGGHLQADAVQRTLAFAKTTRPALGAIVGRERLFARLDGAPGRTVAWISGPPGSGKTSLAASYAEARSLGCLWYQVDPDDADVATFFHYLGHAARKLEGARGRELPRFTPQQGPDVGSHARKFFRQLFARARAPLALVLDNLHAVPLESELHAVLEAAVSQVPKNCLVIVTSRSDSPASFARLRVTGEMVCVGPDELRLDVEELAAIAQLRGAALAAEAARQLHQRTQGWAAGAVLMLEHRKLSGSIAEVPGEATPKVIFDYLAGEIFDRFEPKTQQFLLGIACLSRMSAEVAEELTGEAKAARLLLNLALNHYFVDEIQSDEGRVFQLHPLLRDFLRRRAAQERPEALGAGQLQRAAVLLSRAGQTEDAVALLLECRNWTEVARIAAEEASAMLEQGRSETLALWLESLPPAVLAVDPRLVYALGVCRARAAPRAARRQFEQAFEAFRSAGDRKGMLQSACGVLDTAVSELDDLAPLDHWIAVLADMLRPAEDPAAAQEESDAVIALIRAMLLRNPGSPDLDGWLARAERGAAARPAAHARARVHVALARATAALFRGEFAAAGTSLDMLRSRASAIPAQDAISIGAAAALQRLAAGAYDAARSAASETLAAAESEGVHGHDEWLRMALAAAALGAGDRDGARGPLQLLDAAGARLRRGDRAMLHYLRGWLAVLDGDRAAAHREAKTSLALAAEVGVPWLECLARTALAQLLADAGDRRGSEMQLRSAEALAERLASAPFRFWAQLAAAGAGLALHDEAAGLGALRAGFALGRECGLQHAPWWRSREVADLCALALRHGIEPDFARGLVRARRLVPRVPPLRVRDWPWPFRVRTLGGFQLLRESEPVEFLGKGPGRPLELLKVLIALGGEGVRADQLADALWPHVEADFAHKSFTATLHRLRRLFGDDDALILRDARLGLNPALVCVDSWALEQGLAELEEALRAPDPQRVAPVLGRLAAEALSLYAGPFLPDESEQPSYIACREQVRARLLRCVSRVARQREDAGENEAAADCYLRLIEADDLFEAPYRHLMLCYQRGGQPGEARAAYERLRTVLSTKLRVMPSPESQAVYTGLGAP